MFSDSLNNLFVLIFHVRFYSLITTKFEFYFKNIFFNYKKNVMYRL